jgi:hypothetical protein
MYDVDRNGKVDKKEMEKIVEVRYNYSRFFLEFIINYFFHYKKNLNRQFMIYWVRSIEKGKTRQVKE